MLAHVFSRARLLTKVRFVFNDVRHPQHVMAICKCARLGRLSPCLRVDALGVFLCLSPLGVIFV